MYYGFDIGGTKIALGVFDKTLSYNGKPAYPRHAKATMNF